MDLDVSLLILRVVLGVYVVAHGVHNLFGWFEGAGPPAVQNLREAGFRPAVVWADALGIVELTGGLLFALGLLSPLGSISVAAAMLISVMGVRLRKGWFAHRGGIELPVTNLAVAVVVGILGPGRYSLDWVLGITLRQFAIATAAVVLGWFFVILALNSIKIRIDWGRSKR
jgi:putative oxidoreductase